VPGRYRRRYGAILWEAAASIDDAIRYVQSFDHPDDAIHCLVDTCEAGQRWAVVDLRTMRAVATGSKPYAAAKSG
jgi:hypothetical protein